MIHFKRFLGAVFSGLLLLLAASPSCSAGIMLDRVVAIVNNEAITWSDLYRAMDAEIKKRFGEVTAEQKLAVMKNNESIFLEGMIEKSLLLQEAQKKGLSVRPEEVNRAIMSITQQNFASEQELINTISEEGFTLEEYRDRIQEQILTNRVMQQEVMEKIKVSEEDISSYLKEHGLKTRTQYRVRQIFISSAEGQDVAEGRIEEVKKRLAGGEDFGELAVIYSQGPARAQGGSLGYVSPDQLSGEFGEALAVMSPGDINVISSSGGLHLILLEEIRDVQEALKEALFEDRYGRWLKDLRDGAYIEIKL